MPLMDPRLQAIAQLLVKGQNPVGRSFRLERQNPRGELPVDTLMQLLEPSKRILPLPPSEHDLEGLKLPDLSTQFDYGFRRLGPNEMQFWKANPPYETTDSGDVVYNTKEEADEDK
jgi:hypothetical protein